MANERECKLVLTLLDEKENIPVKFLNRVISFREHHYLINPDNKDENYIDREDVNPEYLQQFILMSNETIKENCPIYKFPAKIEITYSIIQREIPTETSVVAKPAPNGDDGFSDDIPF